MGKPILIFEESNYRIPEIPVGVGDIIEIVGFPNLYILAMVDRAIDEVFVEAISLHTGNRFQELVAVENPLELTSMEMEAIIGHKWRILRKSDNARRREKARYDAEQRECCEWDDSIGYITEEYIGITKNSEISAIERECSDFERFIGIQ